MREQDSQDGDEEPSPGQAFVAAGSERKPSMLLFGEKATSCMDGPMCRHFHLV